MMTSTNDFPAPQSAPSADMMEVADAEAEAALLPTLGSDDMKEEGAINIPEDNTVPVPKAPPSELSITDIAADTTAKFVVGTTYKNSDTLKDEIREFAATRFFTVAVRQRNYVGCSKSAHSYSKRKEAGDHVLQQQESSLVTNCPWGVKFSTGKKVAITEVNPFHNHACNRASAVASQKKSGKANRSAVTGLVNILAPLIKSGRKIECSVLRDTIEPFVSPAIVLDDKTIANILRGVAREIAAGNYKVPVPENLIGDNELKAFTSIDVSSKNCAKVLDDILANINTNGENSWIVTRLMQRLKTEDPYFDYRIHHNKDDHVDCVTWQVGECRGALSKYCDKIFLDVRSNENMNCINMQYLSFIVIDGNRQMIPASESFVFQESKELYGVAVNFTIGMTPNFDRNAVLLGFGDFFLSPEDVKVWFPNITWLVDTFHFCSPKKKDNVLAKSFGPRWWPVVAEDSL
jgi:hypothetical protein